MTLAYPVLHGGCKMKTQSLALPEVFLVVPSRYGDSRGYFSEVFHTQTFLREVDDRPRSWVQDNASRSSRGVLRGLHFQWPKPQAKLVRCSRGAVFDVAVDIRKGSPRFGEWVGRTLTEDEGEQLWIPEGFAHGFVALTEVADVSYKVTEYFMAEHDRAIRWDDPTIGIEWPLDGVDPIVSTKDEAAPFLADAADVLPTFQGE